MTPSTSLGKSLRCRLYAFQTNGTSVSVAVSMTVIFKRPHAVLFRGLVLAIFLALYLGFVIFFGVKLQSWNDEIEGRCYNADKISIPGSAHPYVDNIYLAITALYLFTGLGYCLRLTHANIYILWRRLLDPELLGSRPWYLDHRTPSCPASHLQWTLFSHPLPSDERDNNLLS